MFSLLVGQSKTTGGRLCAAALLCLIITSFSPIVVAESISTPVGDENQSSIQSGDIYIQPGEWELEIYLGNFHATSPVNTEEDIDFYLLPKIRYYGDRFYLENTSLGYSLIENDAFTLDLFTQFNLDALNFETNNSEETSFLQFLPAGTFVIGPFDATIPEIHDRHYAYMGGLKGNWQLTRNWSLSVAASKDVSAVHNGKELQLGISFSEGFGPYQLSSRLGIDLKDSQLSDYYYGLHPDEIGEYQYEPYVIESWTINPNFTFSLERQISEHWSAYGYIRIQQFDSKIADSILISEQQTYWHFIGVKYRL